MKNLKDFKLCKGKRYKKIYPFCTALPPERTDGQFWFDPSIQSELFEFDVRIMESGGMYGMNPSVKRIYRYGTYGVVFLDEEVWDLKKKSWKEGLTEIPKFGYFKLSLESRRDKTIPTSIVNRRKYKEEPKIEYPPLMKTGDLGRMIVNTKNNTILIKHNHLPYVEIHSNVEFPENLKIFMAVGGGTVMKLVGYQEHLPFEYGESDNDPLKERNDFVVENPEIFSSIVIPLKNQSLKMWKSLLLNSSMIDVFETDTFDGLRDLSLNVDEKKMFELLLGNVVSFHSNELVDYYFLLRSLGLKMELIHLLKAVESIKSFRECYQIFMAFCESHENFIIQSWFSLDPQIIETINETSFDTSLALSLFNQLKKMENETNEDPDLFCLNYFGNVYRHIKEYHGDTPVTDHPDLAETNIEKNTDVKLFERLRNNGTLSNVNLVSVDQKVFPCHKEILCSQSNFFHRMFHFKGRELEEMEEKGEIHIEDLISSVLSTVLDFYYNKSYEEDRLNVLIRVLVFADMYHEFPLFEYTLEKIHLSSNPDNIYLEEILLEVGYLCHQNESVNKYLISRIISHNKILTESRIKKLFWRSLQQKKHHKILNDLDELGIVKKTKEMQDEIDVLKKENMEIKTRQERSERENTELRNLLEKLQVEVNEMIHGGGRKRKRENEEAEKEYSKKRRKKE